MTIDPTKLAKVKTAMDNRYENKQSNKKTSISGSYTGDNDSYPTVLACINKFGELVTSWSAEPSDSKYPSEKLVKTALDNKISKSSTAGLVKNDGTIDTSTYLTQHQSLSNYIQKSQTSGLVKNDGTIDTSIYLTQHQDISGKEDSDNKVTSWTSTTTDTHYPSEKLVKDSLDNKIDKSDITQIPGPSSTKVLSQKAGADIIASLSAIGNTANLPLITGTGGKISAGSFGNSANTFCEGNDSRLSDARTPTSHTHGDLTNDGKLGNTANKPVITGISGFITTGSFGTTANTFAEGNHTHNQYLTSHQSLSDIGGTVTVEKQQTAETGYIATYVIKQGGTALSPKINIPKDYLVKSASVETCSAADTPVTGYTVGDKYLDFVINTKDNSDSDEHLYVLVSDLIDTYTAGNGLTLSNNEFSISNGDITLSMLASGVQTSLGYADTFHSSPAAGITSTQISSWDSMASTGTNVEDIDRRINQALDDLAELIYPTSNS